MCCYHSAIGNTAVTGPEQVLAFRCFHSGRKQQIARNKPIHKTISNQDETCDRNQEADSDEVGVGLEWVGVRLSEEPRWAGQEGKPAGTAGRGKGKYKVLQAGRVSVRQGSVLALLRSLHFTGSGVGSHWGFSW